MAKIKNQVKTEHGNIDRDRYLESIIFQGKMSIRRLHKWLKRQNKLLKTNMKLDDFDETKKNKIVITLSYDEFVCQNCHSDCRKEEIIINTMSEFGEDSKRRVSKIYMICKDCDDVLSQTS